MMSKLKLISATAVGTTAFWAIVVAGVLFSGKLNKYPVAVGAYRFYPPTNGGSITITSIGTTGDPSSV